jgi:hypothetical protein
MTRFTTLLVALPLILGSTAVEAAVLRVPGDADSIKDAVAIAKPGDTVEVGAGRWCGAVIDKQLNLRGSEGAVIVGAKDGVTCAPMLPGSTHLIGFYLPTKAASGTTIRHFTFDGANVATDPSSLGLAVYGRDERGGRVDDVEVSHNTVLGTFQSVTNRGGSNWEVHHNVFQGLTTRGVTGGFAVIVMAQSSAVRPQGVSVTHNRIQGHVPAVLSAARRFTGVHVASSDGTEVAHNVFDLRPAGARTAAKGAGVVVTNGTGPGSTRTLVKMNDGSQSDYVVVVASAVPPDSNQTGLVLRGNTGTTLLETEESSATNRGLAKGHEKAAEDDGIL